MIHSTACQKVFWRCKELNIAALAKQAKGKKFRNGRLISKMRGGGTQIYLEVPLSARKVSSHSRLRLASGEEIGT